MSEYSPLSPIIFWQKQMEKPRKMSRPTALGYAGMVLDYLDDKGNSELPMHSRLSVTTIGRLMCWIGRRRLGNEIEGVPRLEGSADHRYIEMIRSQLYREMYSGIPTYRESHPSVEMTMVDSSATIR